MAFQRTMCRALLVLALAASSASALDVAFNHGVASGDPLHDAIIIWTRATPRIEIEYESIMEDTVDHVWVAHLPAERPEYDIEWVVSEHEDLSEPVQHGTYTTGHERDYTVKVDVGGLESRKQYYYGFKYEGAESPVGRFRLPPKAGASLDELKYGVFTCSNWGWGYFNAYDYASQLDLDFWVHVGDYFYEYSPNNYPSPEDAVRYAPFPGGLQPPHEITQLPDYRARHAHYKTDPGLQALHASAPLISIWDDHEHTNDPWADGAQNHQSDEGDWEQRKEWSVRAYHEWMPIRSGGEFGEEGYVGADITRSFAMGDLARVVALEQRLTERTMQYPEDVNSTSADLLNLLGTTKPEDWSDEQKEGIKAIRAKADRIKSDPERQLIGSEQLEFLEEEASTDAAWLLVVQTTNVHDMITDYTGAIELARKSGKEELADKWQEALDRVTTPDSKVTSYSTSPHLLHKLGDEVDNTEDDARSWIADIAAGEYGIITWFDPWSAYTVEREKFVKAMAPAGGNAIVYSGDTHAPFASMLRDDADNYYGAEYSCPAVTSPDSENGSTVPLELHNAAQLVGDAAWKDTRFKGFQHVHLTKERHHVDWVVMPWGTPDYTATCHYAFDLPSAKGNTDYKKAPPAKDSKHGLPVSVIERQLDPAGKDATRPAMHVVECSKLPEAKPYAVSRPGVSNTLAPEHLVKNIHTKDVY